MLQNDKINCNGSFRDITMHFVTDPCVNVSIPWIIIMYHVKPSCCTTPKIHWDMSNFLVHLKASGELWCGSAWQRGRRVAVALLPCCPASRDPPPVPTTLSPPCVSQWHLCWHRGCDMAELTPPPGPGLPTQPQLRAESPWNRARSVSLTETLSFKREQQQWKKNTSSTSWKPGRSQGSSLLPRGPS